MSRKVLVAGVCGLLGLALAGCGAAQTAATAQDSSSAPGVDVSVDGITIRNAMVEYSLEGYPAGGEATVLLTILNQTTGAVELAQVSSSAAAAVNVTEAVRVAPEAVQAQTPPPGQPPPEQAGVELAPGTLYSLTLQATGLREALSAASSLPLELTIEPGAAVQLNVPVVPPPEPLPAGEPLDVGHQH